LSQLPVIVGFGGINPAGRASFHQAYKRLILDTLDAQQRQETLCDLATLMGLDNNPETIADHEARILSGTLIRQIESDWFDVDHVLFNKQVTADFGADPVQFRLRKRQMPLRIPANWTVTESSPGYCDVEVYGQLDMILPDSKPAQVQSAGMLPTGFKPGTLYQSRNHPRNLQMTVYAASDALYSTGLTVEQLTGKIRPDQIAVYASNSIGQLDDLGFGGLTKFPALGKRTTSKQMPLGYAQMPADFINAYILGNVGATGGSLGACATFLYNLKQGVEDIRSGRRKLVLVGGSDAPVTEEIIEGFRAMGALAEDKDLLALNETDALQASHYRSACRPFGNNCGFTIGESSQFVVLMSDDLAIELGADIHGAVPEVFVNADGHKKSISAPGVGNYITLGRAASLVRNMLGDEALKQRSYVQAHGTSTPQNRVTESHVINETARAFGISQWPVAAIKCFIGHSQGTAGGDQLTSSLGTWQYGYIPGILTTPEFAADVYQSNLLLSNQHLEVGSQSIDAVLLNSKGFGGNNASAPVLAPHVTEKLLAKRYTQSQLSDYAKRREAVRASAHDYNMASLKGDPRPIYRYDYNVLQGEDLTITEHEIRLPGYNQSVPLDTSNPFEDLC